MLHGFAVLLQLAVGADGFLGGLFRLLRRVLESRDALLDFFKLARAVVKAANQQMGQLITAIKAVFPQAIGTSATATGGAATLPAQPVGFLDDVNPATGATVKVPYYT